MALFEFHFKRTLGLLPIQQDEALREIRGTLDEMDRSDLRRAANICARAIQDYGRDSPMGRYLEDRLYDRVRKETDVGEAFTTFKAMILAVRNRGEKSTDGWVGIIVASQVLGEWLHKKNHFGVRKTADGTYTLINSYL